MKSIVIAANKSGAGKTTVTLGLLKVLKNRGFNVQSYKVGPDYIDSAFHSHITKLPGRNLDLYLMGENGVKASVARGEGDLGIIEGVMGIYDGKGITTEYSTAHLAKVLNLPILLIISPKAQVATLCAEINGIKNFENINIAGVIINNINGSYYNLLKLAIEKICNVKVFGYLPKDEDLALKSRHLGLIQSCEIEDLDKKVELCAKLLEENVDMGEVFKSFKEVDVYEDKFHVKNKGLRIAVALDKAFNFYYKENLELLGELGDIVYFSPIKDKELPININFLYIGGGYPEIFIKELSNNKSMLKSIKNALESGLSCYAECGGLMYLTEAIEGEEVVGFFQGESFMSKKLQNFGYAEIEVKEINKMLNKGLEVNCHEFHKSYVNLKENKIYKVSKNSYDGTLREWDCGYIKNNTIATYTHIHFFGNIEIIKELVSKK